jgi:predicted NBD/HSP70 family sugar kinase
VRLKVFESVKRIWSDQMFAMKTSGTVLEGTITAEHIRRALARHIALMFGTTEQSVCNWRLRRNHVSGQLLERASKRTGVPKTVLLEGLELRAKDADLDEEAREFLDQRLASLGLKDIGPREVA